MFVYESGGNRQLTSQEAPISSQQQQQQAHDAFVPQLRFHKQPTIIFIIDFISFLFVKPKCHFQYLDHFHRCRRSAICQFDAFEQFSMKLKHNSCVRLCARRSLAKMIYNNYMRGRLCVSAAYRNRKIELMGDERM